MGIECFAMPVLLQVKCGCGGILRGEETGMYAPTQTLFEKGGMKI
jgi:hypothetical protein